MSMASSSVLKRNSGATGPKVSSRATAMSAVTSRSSVGSKKLPPSDLPPTITLAPFFTASSMCSWTLAMAALLISGPVVVPASVPSPTFSFFTASASLVAKASYTPSCTRRRLAQTHVCPALRYFDIMAPCTAASRSASSKTMNGALPPSSSPTFLMVGAHCAISTRPTSVEPVKVSARTMGFEVISAPISRETPVNTENTPAGKPARSPSSAMASAESGVSLAGFTTKAQPAASAGPALRVIMALGKFHGVMAATTPTGCLMTIIRPLGHGDGIVSP